MITSASNEIGPTKSSCKMKISLPSPIKRKAMLHSNLISLSIYTQISEKQNLYQATKDERNELMYTVPPNTSRHGAHQMEWWWIHWKSLYLNWNNQTMFLRSSKLYRTKLFLVWKLYNLKNMAKLIRSRWSQRLFNRHITTAFDEPHA